MRNSKLSKFGLVAIASFSMLSVPEPSWAEDDAGKDGVIHDSSKEDASKEDTSRSDLDNGRFSRSSFRVSVSLRGGYDDNVNTTSFDEQESAFLSIGGTIAYNFGSPRTQLSLTTGGGLTYYLDDVRGDIGDSDNYDSNIYLSLSATHRATPRLTFAASIYTTYQTQPDFSLNAGLNRRSGNFLFTSNKFSMSYLWAPRFSTVTSYTFGALFYDEDSFAFEDRIENTIGNEFRFLVLPTTSLIAEHRVLFITYDMNDLRDATSNFLLAGVDHRFNPRLNLSLRGGAEFRDYDNPTPGSDGDVTNPYFEGTLIYALGKRTSISWTNRYGLEEPDVADSRSRTTFRTGLSMRCSITPRISTNLAVFYRRDDNDGFETFFVTVPGFTEDSFDLALSARYAITRSFALEGGYNYTEVDSGIALRSYTRNRFWGGVNFSF
jgi:hypothetical protein